MEPQEYRVTIRLSPELYAQLEARGSQGQPMAAIVREALTTYLAQQPGRQPLPADMAATAAAMAVRLDALETQVAHLTSRIDLLAAERQPSAVTARVPTRPRQPGRQPSAAATGRGIAPLTLEVIRQARAQHSQMSLREFAQWLYDAQIYRTSTGGVVNAGTLARWLADSASRS